MIVENKKIDFSKNSFLKNRDKIGRLSLIFSLYLEDRLGLAEDLLTTVSILLIYIFFLKYKSSKI